MKTSHFTFLFKSIPSIPSIPSITSITSITSIPSMLLLLACQSQITKPKIQSFDSSHPFHSLPPQIQKLNQSIPSFQTQISLNLKNQDQNFSADGFAFVQSSKPTNSTPHPKHPLHSKNIKLILTDTLTQDIVFDLVVRNQSIYIQNSSNPKQKPSFQPLSSKSLKKIIPQWKKVNPSIFLNLIQGHILLIKPPASIQKQENQNSTFFQITQNYQTQLLSFLKKNPKPQSSILYSHQKKLVHISYKKFFPFPKLLIPKHIQASFQNTKLSLYLYHFKFQNQFQKSTFQPGYPKITP